MFSYTNFCKIFPEEILLHRGFVKFVKKKLSKNLIDLTGLNVVEIRETVENFIDVSDHG